MRKILILISFFLLITTQLVNATTYYIATNGSDGNNGTSVLTPFKTWDGRLNGLLVAGDIVNIRGGIYYGPKGNAADVQIYWQDIHGNSSNYITIQNYLGEVPIFNCSNIQPTTTNTDPNILYIKNCSFVHFKGLHLTYLRQVPSGAGISRGWSLDNSPNCIMEQIEVSRIGGGGFNVYNGSNDLLFLKCDSHDNGDPFSGGSPGPYGNADGYDVTGGVNATRITFDSCTASWNSDDGWDNFNTDGIRIWKNCIAHSNGYRRDTLTGAVTGAGDGNGIKLGPRTNIACGVDVFTTLRFLNNCVAYNNKLNGFDQNGQPSMLYQLWNCTAYKNGAYGFQFQYSCSTPDNLPQNLKNNISYLNTSGAVNFPGPQTNVSNNTWNGAVSLSAADFQGLDSTGNTSRDPITGALAVTAFLRLKAGSDLIDAGIEVGLPHCGLNPDMGAYEFCSTANIPPVANAGSDQTITLPLNTVNLSGNGTDADGTISAWSWIKLSGGAAVISNGSSQTSSVTNLVQDVYQFQLQVTDNNGATATDVIQVTVNAAPATAPNCNAITAATITLPTNNVALSIVANSTDGGSIISYSWTRISGPNNPTITNANTANATASGLIQGTYVFRCLVTANNTFTCSQDKTITVNPAPNQAPTSIPGNNQTITLPTSSVNFSGSGTDPDGTITGYLWVQTGGPNVTITNPNSAATTVTGFSIPGPYSFNLRVTDNNGATGNNILTVNVNAAIVLPTANAGSDKNITLPINTAAMNGSGTGTAISYLWTKLSGPATGSIQNSALAITQAQNLVQGVYTMQFKVTDASSNFATDVMTITVNAAPNILPTANAGADQSIQLPTNSVTLTGSGIDPDGTITGYSWTKLSGPASGTIATPTTATTSVTGLIQGVYQFKLQVTDNNGGTGNDVVQITVVAATNIPPVANAGPDQIITLPVSSATLLGNGTDADGTISAYLWTKLSGPVSGVITSSATQNSSAVGLVQGTYIFQLKVTDNSGGTATDNVQIIVNAAIVIPPTADAGSDKNITLPVNGAALNGAGTGTGITYAWTKVSGPSTYNIANSALAVTSVSNLVQGTYKFELKVTDNTAQFAIDTMQIVVNPAIFPPVVDAGTSPIIIELPLDSVNVTGTVIVSSGTLVSVIWNKVSGPSGFSIVSPSSLSTKITGLTQGTYKFLLTATGSNALTGSDTVVIIVLPVNAGTISNIILFQAILYRNGIDGDVGWTFDFSKSPRTKYMVAQILDNGIYKDFGNKILPTLKTNDYWSLFSLKNRPKGKYIFRAKEVFVDNKEAYSKTDFVVKKK